MTRYLRWILAVLAVVTLEVILAPFLPGPLRLLRPSLLLVMAAVTQFRFNKAVVGAVGIGLLADILAAVPGGGHVFGMVLTVIVMIVLFTRVLTNVSLPALAGLNAASFIVYYGTYLSFRVAQESLNGHLVFWSVSWPALVAAFFLQTFGGLIFHWSVRRSRDWFESSFILAR
ncbi:hypothetical protein A3C96_00140 [Candidatus Uhrbacteria bacterium RIFCSPHIGHO2_02_FULL_60_10]|uniref:Rod shape-determining protein MreD n=1 Tax=Candidatus Uhrbacteria bacterium RIFCSPHIGHO2_02_FULL_60_10 TaxID=1802392 RepID=A0A1F7U8B8_9BACT|nr:MAG: hypothetical protein A3C96_00140 [Candidatus Uhrbacteria bacterium RIFCSPHIGHO2_02_FULL_60_10]